VGVCPDDPLSEVAYKDYHTFLKRAAQEINGEGLLIDLHGQNHKQNSIELGYLLHKSELNSGLLSKRTTSVHRLHKRTGLSLPELLYGSSSLGALFEDYGYKAVPSPRQERPGEHKYYSGGFITQTHGSSHSGDIDSIQIEVPSEIRSESEQKRTQFSRHMAKVIETFHARFYCGGGCDTDQDQPGFKPLISVD